MCTGVSVWFIHLTAHAIGPGRLATFCPDSCQGLASCCSSLATCCGGRGANRLQPITGEPIGAAKRARRQTKNRDETLSLRTLNLNLGDGHVSVQGPVKHPKLGAWTLEHRVGRLSSLNPVKIVQMLSSKYCRCSAFMYNILKANKIHVKLDNTG